MNAYLATAYALFLREKVPLTSIFPMITLVDSIRILVWRHLVVIICFSGCLVGELKSRDSHDISFSIG